MEECGDDYNNSKFWSGLKESEGKGSANTRNITELWYKIWTVKPDFSALKYQLNYQLNYFEIFLTPLCLNFSSVNGNN